MSHYYDLDGRTAYEVEGANGKMRPTTIRDARKLNLVPSVTTIMSIQDKPGLLIWKQNQLLDAAVKSPFHPLIDDEKKWRAKILRSSTMVTKKAAENGTKIHDAIEIAIKNDFIACKKEIFNVVEPILLFLKDNFDGFEFIAEDSFAHPMGFGGKIDLYGIKDAGTSNERRMVLDFKTKNKTVEEMKKIKAFDDHHIQTAAYVKGLEDTKKFSQIMDYQLWERYNLFIGYDIDKDGIFQFNGFKLTESNDFEREFGMFEQLLLFWQLKNNYLVKG